MGSLCAESHPGGLSHLLVLRSGRVADYDFAEVTKGLEGGEVVSLVTPPGETSAATQAFGGKGGPPGGMKSGGKSGGKTGGSKSGGEKGGGKSGGGVPKSSTGSQ